VRGDNWRLSTVVIASGAMVIAVALAGQPSCAGDNWLARVRQAGVLRIAVDLTYPPMEFEEHGR